MKLKPRDQTPDTLTTTVLGDTIVVRDAEGGVWWPEANLAEALRILEGKDENLAHETAIVECVQHPMRGEWRS